ncbi:MAG: hydroxyacid dehydrogenase, partial [Chloroflexi bacterium]|nr:hydroxyacid dehydrogenase [Chloroflexota bacterium]
MKILIASSIYPDAIAQLKERHEVICAFGAGEEELKARITGCEALIFRSGVQITADVMRCAPDLRLILRAGSGIDNIDLDYVQGRQITLVRIPGPGAKAVAEMSFALMLALARNVLTADRLLRQGRWAKHELTGYLLTGKVLGIVGAGNIGTRVGRLGAAWDMEVLGCVEHPTAEAAGRLATSGIRLATFAEVLARSDFVSIHVPLKGSTRYLINAQSLARMKPGAFLINLARGGVVNEAALYQTLCEGRLAGAALDVHEQEGEGKISPLAELPNVILTPHIGAGAIDSQREIGEIILETIDSFAAQGLGGMYMNGLGVKRD